MKRMVIFANGNLSNFSQAKKIVSQKDVIVCADGGVKHVIKLGLIPQVIIGDGDSISKDLKKKLLKNKINWIKYPVKKDKTDFELVVDYVLKNKYQELIIFGLLGDRLDHLLANIFLLAKIFSQNDLLKIKIIEGKQEAFFVNKEIELKGEIGDIISLITLTDNFQNISTEGLEYKLSNESLFFGSTRGVSNIMLGKSAKITIKKGTALIIHYNLGR
ncbi:thiamine diphosphokinase [Candidatus Roizmanbacteria bacterium CG22_combo_CG10-13_8_21_14_all_35_9]|uniref:Thiamine diphosphokinase n=4 Tax=Candidatus Roizmaniibacteriota TaxID=1752723 RepID=A0A2M8F4U5_9BACT|nr:MAG: thiamine diphosphokinase [Candidatus Roizmanbacteria bacterium CG23_combo_of_CG06-09_8_20_14_all_35_49]PIP62630.1 MAG: thiamine diphosphokinase [Candidatus Roizmanbacteria bacterium CG22_combo_CG10-13_8_21_14_all_35_9]PIY71207.1 MAG: thiamine diphosphokinase [Candidatus Roizmanbacteria bacterium CG_4_10_14_0_8_um_filter_35_28]PJC34221.1 MAG: thiamine diphosphokinase [Candidatus Roizmanbacteria bacterium CG_4_9_14_0_2_um_filter_35_15]PJC82635.1 MAG: thiamine diphosphokinase [Candidatus R